MNRRSTARPLFIAGFLALVAAGCGSATSSPSSSILAPSTSAAVPSPSAAAAIDCTPPATPTVAQTEGPYFTAGSPERADLVEPGMGGTPVLVTGLVLDTDCRPLAGAKVDAWQADADGVYDNAGYRLRGHVFTDADGRYAIRTVVPGEYPGRTPHIHVKITPVDGATLTSQLYLPTAEAANAADRIFESSLVVELDDGPDGLTARFDFVVES
jgi:protocatechuate 3,4-dioxygenase beta subunit